MTVLGPHTPSAFEPRMVPQILDVTLRDGGYVNGWQFPLPSVLRIVSTLARAGIPRVEVGYFESLRGEGTRPGPRCCDAAYLAALASVAGNLELVSMVRPAGTQLDDYARLADGGISRVRFVVGTAGVADLGDHLDAAHRAGLACSVNLIRLSERTTESVVARAKEAEAMGADWLYAADSNGSMFPDRVGEIYRALSDAVGIPLGFHAHDPLRLALANSLAAVREGAQLLDSSLGGMGKGAGNLVTELITSHLNARGAGAYDVVELVAATCDELAPWVSPQDHWRRSESALSALLDLNVDDRHEIQQAADRAGRPLLSELHCALLARTGKQAAAL